MGDKKAKQTTIYELLMGTRDTIEHYPLEVRLSILIFLSTYLLLEQWKSPPSKSPPSLSP